MIALAAGFDGSINIDTRIDSTGFNRGIRGISSEMDGLGGSLKKLAAIVATVFSVRTIVNFGKASIKASTDLSNAMIGLQSIVDGQGRSFADSQAFLQKYISDGLIPATDAVTAYKNLAMRGYTDPQIQSALTALKDSAAFGRQASLTLGQAVSSATEGLKNENSILVDNAGVTKNVSVMWADYAASIGVGVQSLTKQQKIQAEVTGIMQETRFQTGDAAKIANTYSGEVLKLGYNFNNLKIAIGNALIPMAQAVLPGLNAIITALTRVANLFAQVTTALFGRQAAQQQAVANTASNIASNSNDAAKAQSKLADATKKAAKAADNSVASFDELNVLQQDTGSTAADQNTPDVSTGAAGVTADQELGAGVTVSPAVQAAADVIKGIFADIDKALGPTKETLAGLWTEFQRLGGFAWQGLLDFYNTFLVPVGKWTLGVGIPGFIHAMKDGMSKVDWNKINTALHNVWEALTPFAINVGSGLLWFYENVLVPFDVWKDNNIIPLFLDALASGINILNGIITALQPLALWLFDNFLKPLAEWTGGVIVSVLTSIKDALGGVSDWINQNQGVVQGATITVGAFFAAWKATELLAFIQMSGGVVAALGSLTGSIIAGTVAKLTDKAETIALTAMYAKDFVVSVAQSTAALLTNAAQWVVTTAAKIADAVAQWAATAAVTAWNAICVIATAVTTAFGAAVAFLTSPIGLVILAIAAVIAIVVLLVTHWNQVKEAGAAAWAWIQNAWNSAAKWFQDNVLTPLENGFKSSINFMIGLVEGFINGFIDGINSIITLLNRIHIDIPDWDIFGDMRGQSFGFDIPKMGRLSIPRLATGAVIPPRAEFAAILGDQRSGTNIEAPEGLIRSIVSDELSKINFSPEVRVIASGNDAGLVRWMKFEIEQDNRRVGPVMATGGGR
ncbi:hypothetical protein [Caproiciproducens faecalis]|uniref:Phage-related protein n=1 Tax=Caproiciproducens faecalis TaxID=2820301 RepID=A0ABS7DSX6_9FIRM|nr:hypothetical protein [Caproiciproducens faecalis]MBW7573920.1 hypothetical protein [Caproiciproducens faecalis]